MTSSGMDPFCSAALEKKGKDKGKGKDGLAV